MIERARDIVFLVTFLSWLLKSCSFLQILITLPTLLLGWMSDICFFFLF